MSDDSIKIRVENVCKIFGPRAQAVLEQVRAGMSKNEIRDKTGHVIGIRDVSLEIRSGETFVIMGLSGSGKSTLIRHINRLIEPTAGRILVDDTDVLEMAAEELHEFRRHKASMVFQRFALLPHKTVLGNVIYGLIIGGKDKDKARELGMKQIELAGLSGFEDHYPAQLSGGMQQRVGLARALATDAEILLMDEAFSALDPLIRNEMQNQLKELQSRLHKTIVFITHDLDEALRLGDRIAILKDGELRQVGSGPDILFSPTDDYVRSFVQDVNRAKVVTIGSIAEPVVCLSEAEASTERCYNLLQERLAVVVMSKGKVKTVINRELAAKPDRIGSVSQGQAYPQATCIKQDMTLEEGFALLAESGGLAIVTDDQSTPIGIVTHRAVLNALAR